MKDKHNHPSFVISHLEQSLHVAGTSMEIFQQEKRDWEAPGKRGTCSQMCPLGEIEERQKFNQLHDLEKNPFDARDSSLMIKKYYRSQTDETRQNSYLRDRLGIALSMDRLRVVMACQDVPFETRASFIWDRYRAIWKDMSIQNWQDIFRVSVLEEMVRFLIFADFTMALEESQLPGLNYQDAYDAELGIQLLLQCFVTLSELYQTMRDRNEPCPNEVEFRIYHALLQMTPVEGRDMEHEEISILFRSLPEELLNEDFAAFEQVQYLYDTMKNERWDEIIDIIWQMEFFEFALGRRILERFREIRFKKYFRRLRQRGTLATHPPMPLHAFCDRFFLDQDSALQFAAAYSMKTETDSLGNTHIVINEGIRKPQTRSIPTIGAGIPPWGFIDGTISIAHFVCQYPIHKENAHFDFVYKQLVWPSYQQTLMEWSFLIQLYNISEFQAALLQSTFWHKLNRVEFLNEIPLFKEFDEEGIEISPPFPLPFFRMVDVPKFSAEERMEKDNLDQEQGNLMEEEIAVSHSDSFFGENEGKNKAFWVPQSQPSLSKPLLMEPISSTEQPQIDTDETSEPKNNQLEQSMEEEDGIEEEEEVYESIDRIEEHPAVGSIYSEIVTLSAKEFQQLVESGRQNCLLRQRRSVGAQNSEERPLPILLLTPVREQQNENLPENANDLFMEYCSRIYGYRPQSPLLLPEEREKFDVKLLQRCRKIQKFEESLPDGWRIRPKRKRQLMHIDVPWKHVELVPKTYPPQLTEQHLLKEIQTHPMVQKSVIKEELAVKLFSKKYNEDVSCSIALLKNGLLEKDKFLHKWIACRIFGSMKSRHIEESVRFGKSEKSFLHYEVNFVDIKSRASQSTNTLLTASAFFVLLDDASQVPDVFEHLQKILNLFSNDDRVIPPVVILDGREIAPGLVHRNAILENNGSSQSELYATVGEHFDCASVDVFIVSLSHHLGLLVRSVFRELCEKWRPHLRQRFCPKDELMLKNDALWDQHDPIDEAMQLIGHYMQLNRASNHQMEDRHMQKVIKLTNEWEKEWNRIKNWGRLLNISDEEELCRIERSRETFTTSLSKQHKGKKSQRLQLEKHDITKISPVNQQSEL